MYVYIYILIYYSNIIYRCDPVEKLVRILWLVALPPAILSIFFSISNPNDTAMESQRVEPPSLVLKAAEAPLGSKP